MNSSPVMIPIFFLTGFAGLLFQMLPRMLFMGGWRHASMDHVWLLAIVLFGGWMHMRRADLSGPPCQLWMCEEGYWFRDRIAFKGRARMHVAAGWLAAICAIVFCAVVVYLSPIIGILLLVFVGTGFWFIGGNVKDGVARHQAVATPSTGDVPFLRWQQAEYISVMAKSKGRHRITIKPLPSPFWTFQTVTDVSLLTEISPERAAEIRDLASRWIGEQRATGFKAAAE